VPSEASMSRLPGSPWPHSGATVGMLLAAGTILGAGAWAWRRGRADEAALGERTSSRLRPLHVEPSAADIEVGR
jgi:hypothetical protein